MNWLNWGLYFVAAFGFAFILGESTITYWARVQLSKNSVTKWLVKLVECPACLGWWTGFVLGLCYYSHVVTHLGLTLGGKWQNGIGLGLITCGANFLIDRSGGQRA